jgi:hypothetical protein
MGMGIFRGLENSWRPVMSTNLSHFRHAQSYRYSTGEKARFLISGMKQRLLPAKNLIAGPFAGELGYELMQWQGYVRARRKFYREVHVITYPGREYLYEGCHVHCHDILLQKAGYAYGLLGPAESLSMAGEKARSLGLADFDVFFPALLCTQYHKRFLWRQDFKLMEEPPLGGWVRDVAFHFRSVKKEGPDQAKNYPPAAADELAQRCLDSGLSVLCMGHPDYAYCARGCEDARGVDLKQGVVAINSARALAGENSGPMHLANLCGKPTVVWANDSWRINYSLRWNPFQVPIYVAADDTHVPPPEKVFKAIVDALDDLRRRTDGFRRACYSLPAQQIAYY